MAAAATSGLDTVNFASVAKILNGSSDLSLGDVLAKLAEPADEKQPTVSAMPTAVALSEDVQRALELLPVVFGQVKTPASRRVLNQSELAKFADEKTIIDTIQKALKARLAEMTATISVHFDVAAEKSGKAKKSTPRDGNGHYQIAVPGSPEEAPISDRASTWFRQRVSDKTVFVQDLLEKALLDGKITRADYLAVTEPVKGRVVSEEKINKLFLSAKGRDRAQKVIKVAGKVVRGTNSIHLRNN
ncbi:hypothetical protein ACFZAM_31405 [Streptomyces sp. NPDC008079]|uniref:hypothetical protein n=1 Tax=Streptomyces sp. NPDC008079 TaxID=3364806 RepID=UPI0036E51A15